MGFITLGKPLGVVLVRRPPVASYGGLFFAPFFAALFIPGALFLHLLRSQSLWPRLSPQHLSDALSPRSPALTLTPLRTVADYSPIKYLGPPKLRATVPDRMAITRHHSELVAFRARAEQGNLL